MTLSTETVLSSNSFHKSTTLALKNFCPIVPFLFLNNLYLCPRVPLLGLSLCVVHGSSRSQWVPAPHGLPQGSVLAPLLYIIYTSELGPLLTDCALLSQLYADDVQA